MVSSGVVLNLAIIGSLAASLYLLHAQTAVVGGFNGDIAPVQSVSDSIVQITADAQGLAQMAPADLPRGGTFWVIVPGYGGGVTALPYPCMTPALAGLPVYGVTDNAFLVDDTGDQVMANTQRAGRMTANMTVESALELQANTVLNLITRVQTTTASRQMRAMGMDIPGFGDSGDGGDGTSGFYSDSFNYTVPTNGLWLEMTGVSNGLAHVNLHCVPNLDFVYEIFSRTDLSAPIWNIETEVFPPDTNQNVVAFTVPELGRTNMFIWARDWTGVTSNGNETPEWWFWEYFGTTALSDTNLDSGGVYTLLHDYTNGFDPNIIQFSISVANSHVNTSYPNLQLNVNAGVPFYYAVLVDSTNFPLATWTSYGSSNVVVNLSSMEGGHQIWIGLRGLPPDATQTWEEMTVTLDTTPPTIIVTSPATSVVSQPMIQVQGLVSENLSSLTFDVSNAAGIFSNQTGYASELFYDTNLLAFTTNYFQCYDVALTTNGLNTISIHATDLAGNTSTTNIVVTLDYSGDTTPPALNLLWPQNGAKISGSSFTLQAQVDDLTAQVTASAKGDAVRGQVQRNGQVRGLTLPLAAGTNIVTVTAQDAAGNVSTTTINVVQSAVTLTINPLSSDQLNQSLVTVRGMVSDPTEIVIVNGVRATVNVDGTWIADNVLVNASGMATINVQTYPAGSDPATTPPNGGQQANQPQPPMVRIASFEDAWLWWPIVGEPVSGWTDFWIDGLGGVASDIYQGSYTFFPLSTNEYSDYVAPWVYQNWSDEHGIYGGAAELDSFYDNPKVALDAGGEGAPGTTKLYAVRALMEGYSNRLSFGGLPPDEFQIQGQTLMNSGMTNEDGAEWGEILMSVRAGTKPDVTPTATSAGVAAVPLDWGAADDGSGQYYTFDVQAFDVTPRMLVDNNRNGSLIHLLLQIVPSTSGSTTQRKAVMMNPAVALTTKFQVPVHQIIVGTIHRAGLITSISFQWRFA